MKLRDWSQRRVSVLAICAVSAVLLAGCSQSLDHRSDRTVDSGDGSSQSNESGSKPNASSDPAGSISWDQAASHVGEVAYVCGPLANSGSSDDDVFLNLGLGYPDPGRLTIVIWDVGAVESITPGTKLCVRGKITLYKGVTEVEVDDPGAVEIWD